MHRCHDFWVVVGDINHGDIQALKINSNQTYAFLAAFLGEMRSVFPPETSRHWHMGGDEMFGECLDQQLDLKQWMQKHGIADYAMLQQYFTKRLRTEVLPQLDPEPPIVVWELNGNPAIADGSISPNDIGQGERNPCCRDSPTLPHRCHRCRLAEPYADPTVCLSVRGR
jgi:hypothetical protein